MCRLAAYLGEPVSLQAFLIEPPHSLYHQAWAPEELRYAKLNADGYGFGWYDEAEAPLHYINPAPIWNDPNLPALAKSLSSDLWIASVRSATAGNPVNHVNTQPFADQSLLFDHNGFIANFHEQVKATFCHELAPEFLSMVKGCTESEYLFALLRQILDEDQDSSLDEALQEMVRRTEAMLDDNPALLNFIVTDGNRIYAVRHAVGDDCPSLYLTTDDEQFPGAQLIASERMTHSDFWHPVPEHQILIIDPEEPPEFIDL
ncbi:MAG: ergothioneine biosynthesis protein EgtC [Gammaproteobacteria bacterium]